MYLTMDKFYDAVLFEVANASSLESCSILFELDRYFAKLVAKYVRKHKIDYTYNFYYHLKRNNKDINMSFVPLCVKNGSLRCLKHFIEVRGVNMHYRDKRCIYGVERCDVDMLEFVMSITKFYFRYDYEGVINNSFGEHIGDFSNLLNYDSRDLLKILIKYNILDPQMMLIAARFRDFDIMKMLREKKLMISSDVVREVGKLGYCDVLQWLYENSYKVYPNYLKLSHNDYFFNQELMYDAIDSSDINRIKWLFEHGYKYGKFTWYSELQQAKHIGNAEVIALLEYYKEKK